MKKLFISIFIVATLLAPSASFAAEEKFFEFASDVGVPVEVPSGSVAIQDIRIYNDFIDAVDLWYDNAGLSGSVTVALLDASDVVLTSKAVTAASASAFYTGQRLHVTFPDTVGIVSGSWYRLRITSNTPELRLYGINRIQFVEHNAPSLIVDAVGNATVDGESQLVAFKFALYEEIDDTGPVLSNVSASLWGFDAELIAFNANELIDWSLVYGPIGSPSSTVAYTGNYSVCFEGIRLCSITIDTARATIYAYRLLVRDTLGNESHSDGVFESWSPIVTPPPDDPALPPAEPTVIPLAVSNARVTAVTQSSVQLSWDTNRAANSTLIVSADPVGSQVFSNVTDGTYELVHTISASQGIVASTGYYATIISHDESGAMVAQIIPFTSAPQSSVVEEQPASSVDSSLQAVAEEEQGSVSITWSAPAGGEPSNGYRIDIIDSHGNLIETRIVPVGTHSLVIAGLAGGDYRVIAYGNNEEVVEKIAEPTVVSVKKKPMSIDTYELIKRPIVYVPALLFTIVIGGLYLFSRKQKASALKK